MKKADAAPCIITPDGRYLIVRGRLWRTSNPALTAEERGHWVGELMAARRAVAVALRGLDATRLRQARAAVQTAKVALGERGPVWWRDGAPDYNRRLVQNTLYANWFASLQGETSSLLPAQQRDADMTEPAFQDTYPDEFSHCYGCGRLNEQGLHLKSRWDGEETVAIIEPRECFTGIPGYVYGGLLASLIDCHGTGTASAAAYRQAGRPLGSEPYLRFVTASLHVDYEEPTPMGVPLELRGRIREVKKRKVVVGVTVLAEGKPVVRGEVVAVQIPEQMKSEPEDEG